MAAWTGLIAKVLTAKTEEAKSIFDKQCLPPPEKLINFSNIIRKNPLKDHSNV
ncbi:hypothetical protein cce_1348 [Crocosphaera subtropica ATCC 51142]|uniref:Uncharacterized protein n=1 Tax=Crocosphaera subtropica (strain ATCC 51142 / BH68) TaxID=43989 RepID=B1WWH4_CROS5|nr:hypothetical protein cce_1348 [Crocosphaera subtropica ATCC 51142]